MSLLQNLLFVAYHSSDEIKDSASFIYFYFHPIDHYKMIMYISRDYNTEFKGYNLHTYIKTSLTVFIDYG